MTALFPVVGTTWNCGGFSVIYLRRLAGGGWSFCDRLSWLEADDGSDCDSSRDTCNVIDPGLIASSSIIMRSSSRLVEGSNRVSWLGAADGIDCDSSLNTDVSDKASAKISAIAKRLIARYSLHTS